MTRCILGSNRFPERVRVRGIFEQELDGFSFPGVMQPEAQQRVIQIVVAGDRREHPLDGPFFLGARPRRLRGLRLFFHCQHGSAIVAPAQDARQAWGLSSSLTRRGASSLHIVSRIPIRPGYEDALQRQPGP